MSANPIADPHQRIQSIYDDAHVAVFSCRTLRGQADGIYKGLANADTGPNLIRSIRPTLQAGEWIAAAERVKDVVTRPLTGEELWLLRAMNLMRSIQRAMTEFNQLNTSISGQSNLLTRAGAKLPNLVKDLNTPSACAYARAYCLGTYHRVCIGRHRGLIADGMIPNYAAIEFVAPCTAINPDELIRTAQHIAEELKGQPKPPKVLYAYLEQECLIALEHGGEARLATMTLKAPDPPAESDKKHTGGPNSIPEWVNKQFSRKQLTILRALYERNLEATEQELCKVGEYSDPETMSANLDRLISHINKNLLLRKNFIGECLTVRERTRDRIKYYYLDRQK